ncbi:MAG TPA: hypothetical protein VFT87_02870 [Candidatus Saccharimonadales bacterium]|nr:hypothetical protein [Candidatus Saccharimonadales bacterium]
MSRYTILMLLNLPLILLAIANSLVAYKTKRITSQRFLVQLGVWLTIFVGLACAQQIYIYLFTSGLTDTESLSLFDVIQITGIVFLFFVLNRMRTKTEAIERRMQNMHQALSILLSEKK